MSYSTRWQELFGPLEGDARMALASTAPAPAPPAGGTGPGNLQHTGGPWTSAAGTAGDLHISTETSRAALGPGHEGVTAAGAGLTAVAALARVRKSWEDRLAAVRDECDGLEGALHKVAKEMGETDIQVRDSFAGVGAKSKDRR
ncbi:hypothetical protein [Streptomyces fradiae]|uniref:hypothetical protein n=1 Tax=Streptomyces fradiae TaxID=1906 RepID=UPI0035166986